MLIAVPIGLFAAIYMAEYASKQVRGIVKPLLEVLAGIPTIVYGFFALITIGPFFRDFSAGLWGALTGNYTNFIEAQSVLTAGFVMSIRLIPFVSSLSDDIITAVPRAMRDGSLGLGATRSETMKRVILPAALPGIITGLRLGAGFAFRGLVFAEIVAAKSGIGYLIFEGTQSHQTARTIVGMIVMGLLWLTIDQFYLRPIERATIQRWGLTVDAEQRT